MSTQWFQVSFREGGERQAVELIAAKMAEYPSLFFRWRFTEAFDPIFRRLLMRIDAIEVMNA